MKPLTKRLILFTVVAFYALLYVATKPAERCFDDCQKLNDLDELLMKDRSYVYGVSRCLPVYTDTLLCVGVKDTIGINWDLLADTICLYANSVGLSRQTILILNHQVYPPDTLARKKCP